MTDSSLPFLAADEMIFLERGSDPASKIQKSKMREPFLNKVPPTTGNQAKINTTSNNYQFILPKTAGYLVNYTNSSNAFLEFTASAVAADLGNNAYPYEYVKCEPWRMFQRPEVRINGILLNPDDNAAHIMMTQDVLDKPVEWMATSDGGSLGLDVNQSFKVNPFLSSQASALSNGNRMSEGIQKIGAIGGLGSNASTSTADFGFYPGVTGAYGTVGSAAGNYGAVGLPFSTGWSVDATPSTLNSTIKLCTSINNADAAFTRFRIPLSLLTGGCVLGDPNSILPLRYLDSVTLTLYPNPNNEWVTYFHDTIQDTAATAGFRGVGANGIVTPRNANNDIQIFLQDLRLCFYTCEVDSDIDAMYRGMLQEAQFWYKTQVRKCKTWAAGGLFTAAGQGGRVAFTTQLPALSAKSAEIVITCPDAISSPYSGWKSTFLDNGIYQYLMKIDGEAYPVMSDYCWNAYQSADQAYPACYQEAYTAYQNYRRSKLSSDYQSMFSIASVTTPWMFSGYNHLFPIESPLPGEDATTGKPMRGGYPLAAACLSIDPVIGGNAINAANVTAYWYPNAQREFRMVADLSSINHEDTLFSGKRTENFDFTALYNGLRNYYFTSATYTPSSGTVTLPQPQDCTSVMFWVCVRANQLIRLSRGQCQKFD